MCVVIVMLAQTYRGGVKVECGDTKPYQPTNILPCVGSLRIPCFSYLRNTGHHNYKSPVPSNLLVYKARAL